MTNYTDYLPACVAQLGKGGAFLLAGGERPGGDARPNPMTIGWCQWGRVWNREICTVFVRKSRYTHALMESGRFTISFPMDDSFKEALAYCGTKSGRDGDKLAACGLALIPPRTEGGVPALAGNCVHFECRVLTATDLDAAALEALPEGCRAFYDPATQATPDGDPHTLYLSEILAVYGGGGVIFGK